ncbi:MAG: SDR family NAD(P)-dependent oxidoreductase [Planctomycetota bacterium]|nr:MAG: SDR family NAD(P)-dependent oxidoreductase [Planctomycetota bacterium]
MRMRDLDGKLALITGAAAGIGRSLALELARRRVHLLLVDIDEPGLLGTAAEARSPGVDVETCVADLCCPDDLARVVQVARARDIDLLVNNAGVAYYGQTHDMSTEQLDRLLGVNLLAPIRLTHELLPTLIEYPCGHVLNVCSVAGLVGVARLSAYNASKFALVGFSEALRAEYGPRGLGVTALCPGLVRTGIFRTAMTGGEKSVPRFPNWIQASPERIARRAVRAVRRNEGLVVPTAAAQLVWGIKRLAPRFFERMQRVRRVKRAPAMPQFARVAISADEVIPPDESLRRAA